MIKLFKLKLELLFDIVEIFLIILINIRNEIFILLDILSNKIIDSDENWFLIRSELFIRI